MNRICLFTATGAENLGDELITLCEVSELFKRGYEHITVFSHDIARTRRFFLSQKYNPENIHFCEYFPNAIRTQPLRNIQLLWETIKIIRKSDAIFIWGGGLFYSEHDEWHSPLRLWWMRAMLVKLLWKTITYLSLGISASVEQLKPYNWWLFSGNTITVRDVQSQKILQELWKKSTVLPDPVLSFSPTVWDKIEKNKIIGIALRKWFISDVVLLDTIKKIIARGYEVLLLPHSLHPLDETSHDGYYLQNFLLPGVRTTQSIEQTLKAYKTCRIIISMRLHSMILAIDHHIPFIGISYGQKTSQLLREIDWKYTCQGAWDDVIKHIEEIEGNYVQLSTQLEKIHGSQRENYNTILSSIVWK